MEAVGPETQKALHIPFKVAAHAALFLMAVVVGYLGLGVGLQVSPLGAYVLWGVAVALVLLNILWIIRRAVRLTAGTGR